MKKILLTACLLSATASVYADSAPGFVYVAPQTKSAVVIKQLDNAKTFSFSANDFSSIKSTENKLKNLPVVGQVLSSGNLLLPSSDLDWVVANGVASVEVVVELTDIAAFRAALETKLLSKATAVYAFQPDDRTATWTQIDVTNNEELQWLPTFSGNKLGLYIEAAEKDISDISVYIPKVLEYNEADVEATLKNVNQWGDSGLCEVDVECNNTGFTDQQDAVAKYIFISGDSGYLCTGSLLNDLDTSTTIPYFITAGHCVSTSSEAASMEIYWNFQLQSCGSSSLSSSYVRRSGGAILKKAEGISDNSDIGVKLDYSLLELNDMPPNGAYFSGWTSDFQSAGINFTGIHHPQGDVKKISKGISLGSSGNGHYGVRWNNGVTEGGSSGSGIWNDSLELVGVLSGGSSSCSNKSGLDIYTSFDSFYPFISQYIGVSGGGSDNGDGNTDSGVTTLDKRFSGTWYNVDPTRGEVWSIQMLINNRISAYLFTYDNEGDAIYLFSAGNYDPNATSVTVDAYIATGPGYGDASSQDEYEAIYWGTLTFSFTDCLNGTFTHNTNIEGYTSGVRQVKRLSVTDGSTCTP